MALLKALLPMHLRLAWRELTGDPNRTVTAVAGSLLGILLWTRMDARAAKLAAAGAAAGSIAPEAFLLAGVAALSTLFAWLGLAPRSAGALGPKNLRAQPVPARVFLGLAAVTMLVQPVFWIGLGTQVAALRPFLAWHPAPPVLAAAILYIAGAVAAAWVLVLAASAGALPFFRRRVVAALPTAIAMAAVAAFAAGLRIAAVNPASSVPGGRAPGDWCMVFHGRSLFLLLNAAHDAGLVAWVLHNLPPGWMLSVIRGAHAWGACAALAGAAAAGPAVVALLYRALIGTLAVPPPSRRRSWLRLPTLAPAPGVPPALGTAWAREARLHWRAHDIWAGTFLSAAGIFLLAVLSEVSASFVVVWAHLVVLASAGRAFNSFGLDGRAVDRLRLLPVASKQVVLAKSLALTQAVGLQLLPLWAAGAVRLGWRAAGAAAVSSAAALLLFTICGSVISLYFPARRGDPGTDSPQQSGGAVGALSAILVCGLGTVAGLTALHRPGRGFAMGAVALVAAGLFFVPSCGWIGRVLDRRFETLRLRLRA